MAQAPGRDNRRLGGTVRRGTGWVSAMSAEEALKVGVARTFPLGGLPGNNSQSAGWRWGRTCGRKRLGKTQVPGLP